MITVDQEYSDVCVVTHPLGTVGDSHTADLGSMLSALTDTTVVTAALPENSRLRDAEPEVVEVDGSQPGASLIIAAIGFVLLQFRLARLVCRRDEDIILFFGATTYYLPIVAARVAGKTVLVEPRGDVPLTLRLTWEERIGRLAWVPAVALRLLERAGYRVAHHVVTYTPSMAAELGVDSPTCYAHGARFVDTERFDVEKPYVSRDRVVGFFGRLDTEKNIAVLVDGIKELPDDVVFRFIGDGDCRDMVEQELADEIDQGRVEMCGWVPHDQLSAELNELRLVVLPATATEGLPTTILEAMACGTPALATPVSGIPTVVSDGTTGFHLTDYAPEALAGRIESIVDRHPADVSAAARAEIEAEYTFEAAVDRYRVLLNRVDPARGGHPVSPTWSGSESWFGPLWGD